MDPLLLLRDSLVRKKVVQLLPEEQAIQLDVYIVKKNALTTFKSKRGSGEHVPLDAIWFLVEKRELSHADYLQACGVADVVRISLIDRKPLLQYILGETDTCPFLDPNFFPEPGWLIRKLTNADTLAATQSVELDGPTRLVRFARQMERATQTRDSILLSQKAFPEVLDKLKELKKRKVEANSTSHTRNNHSAQATTAPSNVSVSGNAARHPSTVPSTQGYNRYAVVNENEFWQERLGDEAPFQIDTKASYLPQLNVPHQPSSGPAPNANKSASLTPGKRPPPSSVPSSSTPTSVPKSVAINRIPIVLVPSSTTSLINLYNAQKFMESGQWAPMAPHSVKPASAMVDVPQTLQSETQLPAQIQLMDMTAKFTSAEWDRVVAVIVQGAAWQFKGWPWPFPIGIFERVRGIYVCYDDDAVPASVKSWNVQCVHLSRSKRHLDAPAQRSILRVIELHMRQRPELQAMLRTKN